MVRQKKLTRPTENETWVIEEGDRVIQKKARYALENLTAWETLVFCLWVADYGMRNAGDLDTAKDVHADFQSEARQAAEELSLTVTCESFSMSQSALEEKYFDLFDSICDEIKNADPSAAPDCGDMGLHE